jgi:hypothetical protein
MWLWKASAARSLRIILKNLLHSLGLVLQIYEGSMLRLKCVSADSKRILFVRLRQIRSRVSVFMERTPETAANKSGLWSNIRHVSPMW